MTHPEWDRASILDRWHSLWVEHLRAQAALNPNHPANAALPGGGVAGDLMAYERARNTYRHAGGVDPGGEEALWHKQVDQVEKRTHHDLVAALEVFNGVARRGTAHLGLTSSDITDVANQDALASALHDLLGNVRTLIDTLRHDMDESGQQLLVARTHGQPAQLTTWAHRVVTILGPLCDWYDRAAAYDYPMRPPHGAVGTGADLARVLDGWQPGGNGSSAPPEVSPSASEARSGIQTTLPLFDTSGEAPSLWAKLLDAYRNLEAANLYENGPAKSHAAIHYRQLADTARERLLTRDPLIAHTSYATSETVTAAPTGPDPYEPDQKLGVYTAQIAARLGFNNVMDTTRQVYHRSYDLHIAALLAELASIGQTWATDRRLESMLGLGWEQPSPNQVGSSAMPHKNNPRYSERICALAVLTRCYLTGAAETAGMEWFEGDVSTSAARRVILPGMFDAATRLVDDWVKVADRWVCDEAAMNNEVHQYRSILATGAILQAAVEAGMDRKLAHELILKAARVHGPHNRWYAFDADQIDQFTATLVTSEGWLVPAAQLRKVIDAVFLGPIGNISQQMDLVRAHADRIASGLS